MEKAQELRKQWLASNKNTKCSHPKLEKEYFRSTDTGDSVCTTCGETFWDGKIPNN